MNGPTSMHISTPRKSKHSSIIFRWFKLADMNLKYKLHSPVLLRGSLVHLRQSILLPALVQPSAILSKHNPFLFCHSIYMGDCWQKVKLEQKKWVLTHKVRTITIVYAKYEMIGFYITSASHLYRHLYSQFSTVTWELRRSPMAKQLVKRRGILWGSWHSSVIFCSKVLLRWKKFTAMDKCIPDLENLHESQIEADMFPSFTLDKLAFSSEKKNALLRNSGAALLSSSCAESPLSCVPVLIWAFVHKGRMYQSREKQGSHKYCQNTLT